jgi:hypothetical protein
MVNIVGFIVLLAFWFMMLYYAAWAAALGAGM